MALFAHFQHTDSKLVDPPSKAAPVLTVTAANKEMKPVEKSQIEKWAGNLELWTRSTSYSLSRLLISFSESDQ